MNALTLADITRRNHADASAGRWRNAELAFNMRNSARNKERGYIEEWYKVMAAAARVGERAIFEWAQTWEYVKLLKVTDSLRSSLFYSFFSSAVRYASRIHPSDMRHILETYAETPGATVESFRAELADFAGEPEPPEGENESGEAEPADAPRTWQSRLLPILPELRDVAAISPDWARAILQRAISAIGFVLEGERV